MGLFDHVHCVTDDGLCGLTALRPIQAMVFVMVKSITRQSADMTMAIACLEFIPYEKIVVPS
jgi:hypothetical protein